MIGSANDRKTYQFDLTAELKTKLNDLVKGSDGVTGGFAITKPQVLKKSEEIPIPQKILLQEAVKKRAQVIQRMSEGMFKSTTGKRVDYINDFGGSQHRRNRHDAQRNNPYYKLAYSRKIQPYHGFRSKQLFY